MSEFVAVFCLAVGLLVGYAIGRAEGERKIYRKWRGVE